MTDPNDDLKTRIEKAQSTKDEDSKLKERMKDAENMSNGMRAGAELIGSIGGGAFIGWLLDGWLGTQPWMLIVFLMLGIITGFVNVYRTTQNIGHSPGYSQLHRVKKDATNAARKSNETESD